MDARENSPRRSVLKALVIAAGFMAIAPAWSATYPTKPIRFIVSGAPGGGTDAVTRIIANGVGAAKQWQMVVENMPGAGGNIGMRQVATAAQDGYTIGMGESSNLVINPFLYTKLPFDIEKDLAPVGLVGKVPLVLVVGAQTPYTSVQTLLDAAKQKTLFFASAGSGSVGHLTGELWKRQTGIDATHVPYKSAAPAMADVAGGQVDFFFASVSSAMPLLQAGRVRPLAVTAGARLELLPEVPSFEELGQKDMHAEVLYGVVAPSGTPSAVIEALNAGLNDFLGTPDARKALANLGADTNAMGGSVAQFDQLLKTEREKWSVVVKASGARVD